MKIVSLHYCEQYDIKILKPILQQSIAELGGLQKYINKGEKVLLKVNLLTKKMPEEATTTHPVFVQALTEILTEYGTTVIIGDSPGGPFSKSMLKSIYKASGMQDVAEKTEATLNYNLGSFELANPKGLLLKKIVAVDMLNDVDKVISVSKLKTHGMMTFTGAVKNLFGIIPGVLKAEFHLNMPNYDEFGGALVDICMAANPVLSFMDGILGMEGDGPSAGNPRNTNVVLVSDSPYHLDKVACDLIKLDFERVPTIRQSNKRGLCTMDLSDLEIVGDNINNLRIDNFIIPASVEINFVGDKFPFFIKNFVNTHAQPRPVFDFNKCIGCKICSDNCPAKIIEMDENRKPHADLKLCIRCYCCQELCPQKAITIYKPMLSKLMAKLS